MNRAEQDLAESMWAVLRVYIDPYSRKQAAESLLKSFESIALDGSIMEDAITDPSEIEDDWYYNTTEDE